jgi:hypothetical protein
MRYVALALVTAAYLLGCVVHEFFARRGQFGKFFCRNKRESRSGTNCKVCVTQCPKINLAKNVDQNILKILSLQNQRLRCADPRPGDHTPDVAN